MLQITVRAETLLRSKPEGGVVMTQTMSAALGKAVVTQAITSFLVLANGPDSVRRRSPSEEHRHYHVDGVASPVLGGLGSHVRPGGQELTHAADRVSISYPA